MCLFPMDGYNQMLIPPTERARKIAFLLRIVIYFHLIVIAGFFMSALYVDGVVDLLGALIGYMAIRNRRGYNFQQVLCYSIYLGMDCFWSIIRCILFYFGLSRNQVPLVEWQYYVYVITITASGLFYAIGSIIAWRLYKELREIFTRMMEDPPVANQYQGGAHAGAYQAVPSEESDVAVASRSQRDFTPFSGKKYSLR
mmetsp:Transcript_24447/g.36671  ORF Transcript_24447/g.36671 Transcript_24447/m.36671 type:complete len:198 (+) Transcript_24447:94-687(+)